MIVRSLVRVGLLGLALACAGCSGRQSALDPYSPQASSLHWLIWLFVAVCGAVWLAVMTALLGALRRRRADAAEPPEADATPPRRTIVAISVAVAMTAVIISGLTVASFYATRGLTAGGEAPLTIKLRGYQWWWEFTYSNGQPSESFITANEIHVPVGRPVRIELSAADVIHSFWVPQLAGKQDLIPGRTNEISFVAQRAGVYRGQCAEFCGLQHARMALLVVADEPAAFEAWRKAQTASAVAPLDDESRAGEAAFKTKCAACHTIRGIEASGRVGPDLTHVGGRRYIAAGVLDNTRGSMAAWIADPQTIKPGANMPMVALSADELKAVSAYMTSLK
jgi:cytochrome c oxidase subunit 2